MDDFDAYVMREGVAGSLTPHVCRTCKWWEASQPHLGYGFCLKVGNSNDGISPFFIQVGPDEAVGLATTPDFGCNRWEPK